MTNKIVVARPPSAKHRVVFADEQKARCRSIVEHTAAAHSVLLALRIAAKTRGTFGRALHCAQTAIFRAERVVLDVELRHEELNEDDVRALADAAERLSDAAAILALAVADTEPLEVEIGLLDRKADADDDNACASATIPIELAWRETRSALRHARRLLAALRKAPRVNVSEPTATTSELN